VQSPELDSTDNLKEKLLNYFAVQASAGDLAEMLPDTKTFLQNSTPCENPVKM
jgi:hypothetical protein